MGKSWIQMILNVTIREGRKWMLKMQREINMKKVRLKKKKAFALTDDAKTSAYYLRITNTVTAIVEAL